MTMKHIRSRDEWIARAEELERRMRKYESWYCRAANLLTETQTKLGEIHTLLTASMWHSTDAVKSSLPEDLVDVAEEKLNELRDYLAVESDPSAYPKKEMP